LRNVRRPPQILGQLARDSALAKPKPFRATLSTRERIANAGDHAVPLALFCFRIIDQYKIHKMGRKRHKTQLRGVI
jgi:hypothetical protein